MPQKWLASLRAEASCRPCQRPASAVQRGLKRRASLGKGSSFPHDNTWPPSTALTSAFPASLRSIKESPSLLHRAADMCLPALSFAYLSLPPGFLSLQLECGQILPVLIELLQSADHLWRDKGRKLPRTVEVAAQWQGSSSSPSPPRPSGGDAASLRARAEWTPRSAPDPTPAASSMHRQRTAA